MITKFVVDRRNWVRGSMIGDGKKFCESALVIKTYDECYMCCMGFLGEACSIKPISMLNIPFLSEVPTGTIPEFLTKELDENCIVDCLSKNVNVIEIWEKISNVLMAKFDRVETLIAQVNDSSLITDERREELVKLIFKNLGDIDVEFV